MQDYEKELLIRGVNVERKNVNSSALSSVGYDRSNQVLEIEFNSGGIYQYYDVPVKVFESLMNASSHGKYFYKYIENNYYHRKID